VINLCHYCITCRNASKTTAGGTLLAVTSVINTYWVSRQTQTKVSCAYIHIGAKRQVTLIARISLHTTLNEFLARTLAVNNIRAV